MKRKTLFSLIIVLVALAIFAVPAFAQLGDTDVSSFTVQNVSGGSAEVTITFIAEDGTMSTPADLGVGITNPFTLADGASQQVYVPNVPGLASGRYAVMISSNAQVVAQAGVAGTGTTRFSGSYVGFSSGAQTTYLPSIAFNSFGWYSMITVQNVGSDVTDVTVAFSCLDGTTGTLFEADVPAYASVTWALKNVTPTGFNSSTECDGSAVVTSTSQPVVAVNNQNKPSTGATNTFEAASSGGDTLYVPQLSNNYFGWNSALTIRKLNAGSTTVTIAYDDGDPNDTCNLTDAVPTCKLYMPNFHNQDGRFAAIITSTGGMPLLAVAGSTRAAEGWSGGTSAAVGGSGEVAIPNVSKAYFGWKSAINCQNVGGVSTSMNVSYSGYAANAYNTASIAPGGSVQIQVFNESFLPNTGWQGGATITANATGGEIVCTVGNSNPDKALDLQGDWTSQYNAYNK
jgi:hypothetical protein